MIWQMRSLHGFHPIINVYSWNYQDAEEQIEQLDKMITRNVDAIIIVPSDEEALADAFREIRSEGIDLFVIGDYIENSPEGTVFFSNDYYVLGLSHANWIRSCSDFNADSVIYLYYASDANGQLYKQGVLDGLAVLDMPGAITCVEVTGLQDIDHALNDWFEEHGGEEVKEMLELTEQAFMSEQGIVPEFAYTQGHFKRGII